MHTTQFSLENLDAASVQLLLWRREVLLWGTQTHVVAGHCEQGHAPAQSLFFATADVMQDVNVHHTM